MDITGDDGVTVIGWAHLFDRAGTAPSSRPPSQIVFVPGFEIDAEESNDPRNDRVAAVENFRKLDDENGDPFLERLLIDEQYQVWVIEFEDANASVQTNAKVLSKFLQSVDTNATRLTPREVFETTGARSYVLGYSMGGLVARYALTKLENENIDNYTSAYVSIDAPHRGAYLPPAAEIFARTIPSLAGGKPFSYKWNELKVGASKFNVKYNSDAAKQLLGFYANIRAEDGIYNTIAMYRRFNDLAISPELATHIDYRTLRSELQAMGNYPDNLVTIGIANGVLQGGRIDSPDAQPVVGSPALDSPNMSGVNILHAKAVSLAGNVTDYSINLNNPGFGNATAKLCYFHLNFTKRNCSLAIVAPEFDHINYSAGSVVDSMAQLRDNFNDTNPGSSVTRDNEGVHTFIPTVSALDMNTHNRFLRADLKFGLSPFDIIIGNTFSSQLPFNGNFGHATISDYISNQLVLKLENIEENRTAVTNVDGIPTATTYGNQIVVSEGDYMSVSEAQALSENSRNLPVDWHIGPDINRLLLADGVLEALEAGSTRLLDVQEANYIVPIF